MNITAHQSDHRRAPGHISSHGRSYSSERHSQLCPDRNPKWSFKYGLWPIITHVLMTIL
jgi:hypothetical protein